MEGFQVFDADLGSCVRGFMCPLIQDVMRDPLRMEMYELQPPSEANDLRTRKNSLQEKELELKAKEKALQEMEEALRLRELNV